MIPQTPTHPSKLHQRDLGIPAPQMRRIRPTRPAPYHTTNLNPRRTLPPDVGEGVEGVTQHELERSCHFPIIFFTTPQKFQTTSTRFQDVPILLPFRVCYTLPRRLIFFTFSCSYPVYNSHQFVVPPYFGVWYSLLLESCCQLLYLCISR